jgi:hypothetical protein
LQVQKLRGVEFMAGGSDLTIRKGGVEIYPRLTAADHHVEFTGERKPSGVAALSALLGGGPFCVAAARLSRGRQVAARPKSHCSIWILHIDVARIALSMSLMSASARSSPGQRRSALSFNSISTLVSSSSSGSLPLRDHPDNLFRMCAGRLKAAAHK